MASHGIRRATKNAARATTLITCLILGRDWNTRRAITCDTRYAHAASAMPGYGWRGPMSTWDSSGMRRQSSADSLRDCGSPDRHARSVRGGHQPESLKGNRLETKREGS